MPLPAPRVAHPRERRRFRALLVASAFQESERARELRRLAGEGRLREGMAR